MRAVVQRVRHAKVTVGGAETGRIDSGILVYLAVASDDGGSDLDYVVEKVLNLRIFEDEERKMNRSVLDTGGGVLVISQFTLYGDTRKGRRPSYNRAAPPQQADALYRRFVDAIAARGVAVATGAFQERMIVLSENLGPVTILVDSKREF